MRHPGAFLRPLRPRHRPDILIFERCGRVWSAVTAKRTKPVQGTTSRPKVATLLRQAGLRPTRQRMLLGDLLFGNGERHVTAEALHQEALAAGEHVSLATVYNTLHQLKGAGLLRELGAGKQTLIDAG